MVAAADPVWQLKANDVLNGTDFFHTIDNIISLSALSVTTVLRLFTTALCSKLHRKPLKRATSFSAITVAFIGQFLYFYITENRNEYSRMFI